ncbi:MAG: TetR/AcrR family transcriptional regulator [Proteobacteria bacterium]|nr:TetR/AcrR family transcriptional regulator [Pseudomonadota bacterium]
MLDAAGRLFERHGYARTTFDEIAAAAGVGVATVYKYFSSKEGIVVALLRPDLERIQAAAQVVIERPPPNPARAMVKLLAAYAPLGGGNWSSRELLRLTVFPGLDNDGLMTEFVRECDARTQAQIAALLRRQQAAGRLNPQLPIADATAVIFALLNQHFGYFLFGERTSYRSMFAQLSRRVRLVFTDWGMSDTGKRT